MKIYMYKNCGTCKKAKKFLEQHNIDYTEVAVREKPPTLAELKRVLKSVGELKKLFNTSGGDYRQMGLKDTLADMSEKEALKLLRENGNLVKRPFVVRDNDGWVGFKEETWKEKFEI